MTTTNDNIDTLFAAVADAPECQDTLGVLADALRDVGRDDEADLITSGRHLIADGVVYDADLRTYEYREDGGYSEILDAEDMGEAEELARDLLADGDWGDTSEGCEVCALVVERDATGSETSRSHVTYTFEPDHDVLIERAGGDPDCDHDWTSEGEGGCDSNPGVWSTGGTSMLFVQHCRTCGLRRREMHCGSQRNPGECDTVEYEQPESWCAECQSEDCECDDDSDE